MIGNQSQKCSLIETNNKLKRFSPIGVNPNAKTTSISYPIHPYRLQGRASFYIAFPSEKFKNIIAYYHEVHSVKVDKKRFIYPTGNAGIVFCCDIDKPGAFLVGTPTLPREAEYTITGRTFFIVFLWPGLSYAFCPLPAKEITDRCLPLGELLSTESERITERIVCANNIQERVRIFEQIMERHLLLQQDIPKNILYIIKTTCANLEKLSCAGLECRTTYTDRHIRRLFDKYVGISPILFKRIMRYQKTLKILSAQPIKDMAGLAIEAGYYDQPHLIREFKIFQGCTPKHFLSQYI